MRPRSIGPVLGAALSIGSEVVAQEAAQVTTSSSGGLGIFLSEAYSALSDLNSDNSAEGASGTGSLSSPTSNTAGTTTAPSTAGGTTVPAGNPLTQTASSTASPQSTASSSAAKGISTTPAAQSAGTPSAAAASSTAAAAPSSSGHHSSHTLAIALGASLGALALGLLLLGLWCCCRRRRRAQSPRRALSPEDEEVNSWRTREPSSSYTQVSAGSTTPTKHQYPTTAPDMAEHPAMRHENPFVPVPPAPRRSAPNARVGLTDEVVPGQDPFVKPTQPTSILRKPISRTSPTAPSKYDPVPTSYGEPQSPTRDGFTQAQAPYSPVEYQQYNPNAFNPSNNAAHHDSTYSSQGDSVTEPLPTHYNSDRPPTPFGLMGGALAGGAAAGGAAAYTHHHQKDTNSGRHSTSSSDNRSYESAQPPYDPIPRNSTTPPNVPSRSPKRARFSDSVHGGNGSSSSESRTDSGESTWRLSSSMPGGWDSPRHGSPVRRGQSPGSPIKRGPSPRTSMQGATGTPQQQRRMRLSDLQAQEQQWHDQHHQEQFGVGQAL